MQVSESGFYYISKIGCHVSDTIRILIVFLYRFSVCFTNKFGKMGIFSTKRSHQLIGWISKRWVPYSLPCSHSSSLQDLHVSWFMKCFSHKVEKILKGSLDSIPSSTSSAKIQIMGGKVCYRYKGKTLLGVVNI